MALRLACNDVMPGCPTVITAETQEELLRQATEHAREAHGLATIDEETGRKVMAVIQRV